MNDTFIINSSLNNFMWWRTYHMRKCTLSVCQICYHCLHSLRRWIVHTDLLWNCKRTFWIELRMDQNQDLVSKPPRNRHTQSLEGMELWYTGPDWVCRAGHLGNLHCSIHRMVHRTLSPCLGQPCRQNWACSPQVHTDLKRYIVQTWNPYNLHTVCVYQVMHVSCVHTYNIATKLYHYNIGLLLYNSCSYNRAILQLVDKKGTQ